MKSKITIPKFVYKPLLVSAILLFSDIFSLTLSFFTAYFIRLSAIPFIGGEVSLKILFPMLLMNGSVVILFFVLDGLYPGGGLTGVTEIKKVLRNISVSFLIIGLTIYVSRMGLQFSRITFFLFWFFSCCLISIFRILLHNRGSLLAWWNQPVALVGYEKEIVGVLAKLKRARRMAYNPVIILILDKNYQPSKINEIPAYPSTVEFQKKIRNSGIKFVVFIGHFDEMKKYENEQLYQLSVRFPKLLYVLGNSPLGSLSMKAIDLEGSPALQVRYNLLEPWVKPTKRIIDLIICFTSLVITLPLVLLFALLIRIDSPGPIIFLQKRYGKNGEVFNLFKFRTMYIQADAQLKTLLDNDEEKQKEFLTYHKITKDPRITRIGKFLRKTSLDELPQIWNVIRGDMNLVGPRAYMLTEKEDIGNYFDLLCRVSPGLTGWWQVMGRNSLSFQKRIELDEYYISNFSLWLDLYILLKTTWVVISGQGS